MNLCCVVRAIAHLRAGGRRKWVWSNGGMVISGGKRREHVGSPAQVIALRYEYGHTVWIHCRASGSEFKRQILYRYVCSLNG
jgi:hypothetical protein